MSEQTTPARFMRHGSTHAPAAPIPQPRMHYAPPPPPAWHDPVRGHAPYNTPPQQPINPSAYGYTPEMAAPPPAWIGPQGQTRAQSRPRQRMATEEPATPPLRAATLLHGLGAIMSLGLVVLAASWTWQLMKRDVSGVPVVRALEGPMRVEPTNPGGQQTAFQGLAVNQLAGSGTTTESDVIMLAPQPLGLADLAQPAPLAETPGVEPLAIEQASMGELGFRNPNRLAVQRSPIPRARGTSAPPPVQMATAPMVAQPALSTSNDLAAADALAASIAHSVALGLSGGRGGDVDPASIGPGTRLVQLGAYDTPEEARAAWDTLSSRFNPLLDDRGRVIEAAHSGGSVFYRLRAHGFNDERDARRFCAALVAEQVDCIPVLVR